MARIIPESSKGGATCKRPKELDFLGLLGLRKVVELRMTASNTQCQEAAEARRLMGRKAEMRDGCEVRRADKVCAIALPKRAGETCGRADHLTVPPSGVSNVTSFAMAGRLSPFPLRDSIVLYHDRRA